MLGILNQQQVDHVLHSEIIGRIGYTNSSRMHIIPVTYAYHEGYIYVRSKEGAKVQSMRHNAKVCFQADAIDNTTNWRSVLVWGTYEELKNHKDQEKALAIINNRLTPYALSESVQSPKDQKINKSLRAVAYRIKVLEKSGRYEKSN